MYNNMLLNRLLSTVSASSGASSSAASVPDAPLQEILAEAMQQESAASGGNALWSKVSAVAEILIPRILWALLVLVVGIVLVKLIMQLAAKALKKSKLDISLHSFTLSVVKILLYVLLAITCASMLDIPVTSLVTALGAVGLAVSLAVKDSLTNVAGSMLVLVTKPFVVGDYVDIGSQSGSISEIGMVYTILKTVDNKRVCIPNGDVAKASITNYTAEPLRRLDLKFSISYNDDIELAKKIIQDVIDSSSYSLHDPAPLVRVCAHGSHSIDLTSRVWVASENYWALNFDMLEQVKERFDKAGLTIPFNQMELHITNGNSATLNS